MLTPKRLFFLILALLLTTMSAWGGGARETLAPAAEPSNETLASVRASGATFRHHTKEQVNLGRLLFYDKILSGNRNISCATCHHSLTDTGDGLSLSIGEGGRGLGMTRDCGREDDAVHERVPRNAPPVFNVGALEFRVMFHDGRVAVDPSQPSGFISPAGDDLALGLKSVSAAQAMFPVTSPTEMAGQSGENPVADAAVAGILAGPTGVWELLAQRLRDNDEYVGLFMDAYPEIGNPQQITFAHAANAIAAFEEVQWRADNSPFDRLLRGKWWAMSGEERAGMYEFYGRARCSSCHTGRFQTDHDFHAVAMPQIGPGKGDGTDGHDDFGRERVTGDPADRYKFRTPSLRNVALTGPWGHDGAYDSLEAVVRHFSNPLEGLEGYDMAQAVLPPRDDLDAIDFMAHTDPDRRAAIAAACEIEPKRLSHRQVRRLVAFLHALTDPASVDMRRDVPMRVPSGLPLAD